MTLDEARHNDLIDIRCLNLCIGMLERVHGVRSSFPPLTFSGLILIWQNFEDNSTLEGVLADLIIPAVKRKELVMREKGLISLGLCCLIAKVLHSLRNLYCVFKRI
jgi:condensin complex subunit 3